MKDAQYPIKRLENGKWIVYLSASVSPTGKKTSRTFDTQTETQNFIRNRKREVTKRGTGKIPLGTNQMVDAKRAIDLLRGRKENLHEIVKEALEAKELLEGAGLKGNHDLSLPRAAEELAQTYKRTEASKTFGQVFTESYEFRKIGGRTKKYQDEVSRVMNGPKWRIGSQAKGQGFLNLYGDTPIELISEKEISAFIKEHFGSSPYYINSCIRVIKPVFNYAFEEGWIRINPMRKIRMEQIFIDRVDILKIADFNRCTELMLTPKYRSIAVPIAIQMFAGLRSSEIAGNQDKPMMEWDKVVTQPRGAKFIKPYINVTREHAKGVQGKRGTSARRVDIEDNLMDWISTVPKAKRVGTIFSEGFAPLVTEFRKEAGIERRKNILRHSYASYHFHRFENKGKTMQNMGHSNDGTFEEHYYAYDPEGGAPELYWDLRPSKNKKSKIINLETAS